MDILFNNNRPFIEGVSVDEITKSFSTPLYIYSQKKIEKADIESIFQSIINRETANGMPKDIAENLKMNFREKIKTINW